MIKINPKTFLINSLLFILIFQQAIVNYIRIPFIGSIVNSLDELLACFLIIAIFFKHNKLPRMERAEIKILMIWIVIILLGSVSSLINNYQSLYVNLMDAFICSKFVIIYIGFRVLYGKRTDISDLFRSFNKTAKISVVLLFLLGLHDTLLSPFFETGDHRYFLNSIKLFFPHQTYLAMAGVTLLIILTIGLKESKRNIYYIIMDSIVILLTLRSKAIAFIIIYWGIYIWLFIIKFKTMSVAVIFGAIFSTYIAYGQIQQYYFSSNFSPRQLMMMDGIILALEKFPFGTGFGTFGSHMSVVRYSPVYLHLGYNNLYGMSSNGALYLNDVFWPIIIAQFGLIGFILFIWLNYNLFRVIKKVYKRNKMDGLAAISGILYVIIVSIAETSFFNPAVTAIFILLSLIITQNLNNLKDISIAVSYSKKQNKIGDYNENTDAC